MDTMKTGSYLAALRKNAGMTQQEAADRLGVFAGAVGLLRRRHFSADRHSGSVYAKKAAGRNAG